jgi:hypothetical protein
LSIKNGQFGFSCLKHFDNLINQLCSYTNSGLSPSFKIHLYIESFGFYGFMLYFSTTSLRPFWLITRVFLWVIVRLPVKLQQVADRQY